MIKGSGNARRARQQHMQQVQQRRQQRQQVQQGQQKQQNQQNRQGQQGQQMPQMPQMPQIDKPQSVEDLKRLMEMYGAVLSPENKALIGELVKGLEGGANQSQLLDLAARMQAAANRQKQ